MKRLFLIGIASPLLLVFNACSSSPSISTSINNPPPVLAQTTYSNSSLSGTYSVVWINVGSNSGPENLGGYYSGVGTLQLNGLGGITGGTLSFYTLGSTTPCVYTATGTYSVQSTALGTVSLNLSSSTSGCASTTAWQMSLAAADGGAQMQLVRTDGAVASGSAVKQ
jgi:hypothetical protein